MNYDHSVILFTYLIIYLTEATNAGGQLAEYTYPGQFVLNVPIKH